MGTLAKRVFPRAWGFSESSPKSVATDREESNIGGASAPNNVSAGVSAAAVADASTMGTAVPPRPSGVFHVSIAQCYDKKLEASRKDFRHEDVSPEGEVAELAEVDLVLTAAEVMEMIEERAVAHANANGGNPAIGFSFGNSSSHLPTPPSSPQSRIPTAVVPTASTTSPQDPPLDAAAVFFRSHPAEDLACPLGPGFPVGQAPVSADGLSLFGGVDGEGSAGGNSGGYLEHVFRYAALRLFGRDLAGQALVYREGRNADFRETSLEVRVL